MTDRYDYDFGDTSSAVDSSEVDQLTTSEEYLSQIEYNTHLMSVSVNYIYVLLILVLTFVSIWCIFKHWFFDGI